jgi:hypothetical protein
MRCHLPDYLAGVLPRYFAGKWSLEQKEERLAPFLFLCLLVLFLAILVLFLRFSVL